MSIINYLKSQIPPDLDPWVFNKKDDDATSVHSDIAMEDSEGKVQYVVERVLSKRKNSQGEPEYLIKWKGHTYSELSWEVWSDLIRQNQDPDLLKLESKSEDDSVKQSRFRKISIAQKDAFGTDLIEKINRFNAQLRSSRMSKIQCFRSRKIPFTSKPHFPRFWIEGKEEGYFDKVRAQNRTQWQIGCPNYEILRNFKPFKSPKRKNYIIDEDPSGVDRNDFYLVDRARFGDVTSSFTGSHADDTTEMGYSKPERYTKPEYKRETYAGHRNPQLASKRVVSRYDGEYPPTQPYSSYYATDGTSDMQDPGKKSRPYPGEAVTSDLERSSKLGTDASGADQQAQQSSSDLYPARERSSSGVQVLESDKRKTIHYAAKMATLKPREQQFQKEEDSQYSEQQSAQQPSDSREDDAPPTKSGRQDTSTSRRKPDADDDRYDFESNYKRRHEQQQKLRQPPSKVEEDESEISASAYQMVKHRQGRQEPASEEEEPVSSRRPTKKPSTIREESDSYPAGSSDTPSDAKPDLRVNLLRVGKDKRRPSGQPRKPDLEDSADQLAAPLVREKSGSRRHSRRLASVEASEEESTPQVRIRDQRMSQAEIRRHTRSRSGRKSKSRDQVGRRRSTSRGSRRRSGRSSHKSRSKSRASRKSRSRSRGSRSRRRMESELRRRSRSRSARRSRSRHNRLDELPLGPRGEIGKNSMEKIVTAIFDKDGQFFEVSWKKENGVKPANSLVEDQLLARVYPNELIRYITSKR